MLMLFHGWYLRWNLRKMLRFSHILFLSAIIEGTLSFKLYFCTINLLDNFNKKTYFYGSNVLKMRITRKKKFLMLMLFLSSYLQWNLRKMLCFSRVQSLSGIMEGTLSYTLYFCRLILVDNFNRKSLILVDQRFQRWE